MAQQIDTAQLLKVLEELGLIQTGLPRTDKKFLTDLLKDYDKYTAEDFEEFFDPLTPKYADNQNMIDAFLRVEEGYVPDEIIMDLGSKQVALTPTEEQDLKDYYSFVKARDKSIAERNFLLSQASVGAGINAPSEGFDIPMAVIQSKFRDTYAGKPVTTVYEDLASKAMADWEASPGYGKQKMVDRPTGEVTTNIRPQDDLAASIFNKGVDFLQNAIGPTFIARKMGLPFGGPSESTKISRPVTTKVPAFDPRRYYAEEMAKMAENERQKDLVVQQTLTGSLNRQYGSPYEMQIMEAIKRLGL